MPQAASAPAAAAVAVKQEQPAQTEWGMVDAAPFQGADSSDWGVPSPLSPPADEPPAVKAEPEAWAPPSQPQPWQPAEQPEAEPEAWAPPTQPQPWQAEQQQPRPQAAAIAAALAPPLGAQPVPAPAPASAAVFHAPQEDTNAFDFLEAGSRVGPTLPAVAPLVRCAPVVQLPPLLQAHFISVPPRS